MRVSVITTAEGIPVEFVILPARFVDIEANLPLDLPTDLIADAAYTQYEWAEYLKAEGIRFLVQARRNACQTIELCLEGYERIFRRRIETVFGELMKLFAGKIHATTLKSFLMRIQLFLIAFQIHNAIIKN